MGPAFCGSAAGAGAMKLVRRLVLKALRRRQLQRDLEAELAFHREMSSANGGGVPFGNVSVLKESAYDLWRFNLVENFWRDAVYGIRRLVKSPGYSLAVLFSLALGIGISTAMFTLLNAVVFRPLSYPDESRLVWFTEVLKANSTDEITITPDFLDWRRLNHSLEEIAGINPQTSVITGLGRPLELHGVRTSASLLRILRVQPLLGRNFTREENLAGGAHIIVVSHAFWREHLNANRSAIGKALDVDGEPYTLVGVLPAGFVFPSDSGEQFLIPLAKNEAAELARDGKVLTVIHGVVGRLKQGVTLPQAQAEIAAIQSHLPIPPFHPTITIKMLPLRTFLFGDQKRAATVFVLGALLFLIVASANLGNLALSQLVQRQRELAVRRALGAGQSRVVAQLLIENAVLAGAAALLGLFVGWGTRNILASMPTYSAAIYAQLPLDLRVVFYMAGLLALVVIVFGLIPAIRISDMDLASAMTTNQSGSSGSSGHLRFLSAVATAEIAVVIALSTSAILLLLSFHNMRYRELGIQTEQTAVAELNLSGSRYKDRDRELAFLDALSSRTTAIPGVDGVALSVAPEIPPGSWHAANTARIEGRPLPTNSRHKALTRSQVVSADYFKILAIPLLEGRLLQDSDRAEAPPVALVSREFARRYFPGQDPIGHRVKSSDMRDDLWYTIAGVVGDVKSSGLAAAVEPVVYISYGQSGGILLRNLGLIVRSSLPLATLAPSLRELVSKLDPEQPVSLIETMDSRLNQAVARPRFAAGFLTVLSLLGAVLAMVGVYGLVSCRIRFEERELAVRQALGAPMREIIGQIMRDALGVAGVGLACGLTMTLAAARVLGALLFQVSPHEPLVLAGVSAAVLMASLGASVLPAWKATRSDPLLVLREI